MSIKRKILKGFLEHRYPKFIVDRILTYFEFNSTLSVCEMVDKFNLLIDASMVDKFEFCFYLYDVNGDGVICMKDLMDLMHHIDS